ncbi:MAG: chromosomal replication initiator protein DnaA [Chloroflexi bacterium]|nr:chromosomal replication initiator protein DnaA [Chloroflexota bacterium]
MRTAKEIWDACKGALQVQVSKSNFDTWLRDTEGISCQGKRFVVGTPSTFAKEWLEKRLHSLVVKVLIGITGQELDVHFQVCPSQAPANQGPAPPLRRPASPTAGSRYTFSNFVVGDSNRLAYAASLGVAEEPGRHYNPLFIHGGSGLGKTHLAQAIGCEASDNGFQVVYVSSEQFTNEFITSIREKKMEEFRGKFRNTDLLIIEDIQFMVGKPQTQETLFHTFNALHDTSRQLVLTGDCHPRAMTTMEPTLSSRLSSGLVAQVQPPDKQMRLALLKARAEEHRMLIDEAVFDFIAQRCAETANVRELEGALNTVVAHASLLNQPPTLELAHRALLGMPFVDSRQATFTPASILKAVADHFQLAPESLKGRKKDRRLTLARQIVIYLVREKTNCPLQDIGKLLGGRDHSTVLRSYHKIATLVNTDTTIRGKVNHIATALRA